MAQPRAGRAARVLQPPTDLTQADPLDAHPGEHLAHHARFVLHHLDPGDAARRVPAEVAVAIRGGAHGADRARERGVAPPAPAALQDAGALVFGDHTLHLQEQVVLGGAADGAVEEHHFDPSAAELLNEQHLVGVAPRQPVGGVHVDPVHLAGRDRVAQPLQRRARQPRPAATLVHVGVVRGDRGTVGGRALPQGRDLAGHRVAARLSVARYARIQASRDPIHAQPSSNLPSPPRPRGRAGARRGRRAVSGGVGSAPSARRPRPDTAARSEPP